MLNRSALSRAHTHHPRFEMGRATLSATLFGKHDNWSLSQLRHGHPSRDAFAQRLGTTLYDLRVGRALAPSPVKFTDRHIETEELTQRIPIGPSILYRNPDKPADCVTLEPGDAFVISPANCPVTVMERKGMVLAMHTGRMCLIDHHRLDYGVGAHGRRHHSVCQTALERLGKPFDTVVKVFWGVPGHMFKHDLKHPRFKARNAKMYELIVERWGSDCVPRKGDAFSLDLPKLIKDQCMAWGVPEEHIDLTHAYQPPHGTWTNGAEGTERNLVVVSRHT